MRNNARAERPCAACRLGLAPLLAGAVLMPTGALGAEQSGDNTRLETITVEGNRLYEMLPSEMTGGYSVDAATVGTKVPASLRDIPQSISVVTRDAIEDQNVHTLDELASKTPGMRVLSNDAGRSSIYSRGYEYNEYNLDGLPAPMSSINGTVPNLAAFDRIEIMRGPSGLFNSTSEMGGIVNAVRKRPTYDFQGHVSGAYGSWDRNRVETDLSGPINADGSVRGRLVIANDDTEGFADDNDNTYQTFYGALDADLDEATTLSMAYLRQHRDMAPHNGLPTDDNGDLLDVSRTTYGGAEWNSFEMQSNDWLAELTHRFENGGYGRVAARYSDRRADFNYAFGGGPLDPASDTFPTRGLGGQVDQSAVSADASYSQPFEALGQISEFVVGTDYKRYETETLQAVGSFGALSFEGLNELAHVDIVETGSVRTDNRETLEEYGLYSKLTFRPIEPLALIAGGRASNWQVRVTDAAGGGDSAERSDDGEFTGYAGAVFDLDSRHSLYASYSEVFTPQTEVDRSGALFKAREGTQYEAGLKGSYFNGDLNARLSAFRLYDEHYAASVPGEDFRAAIGERRIQGIEAELIGSLTEQWDVIAGYTRMETDLERAVASRSDGLFLLMPDHRFNLWTRYGFEEGALDGVHLGGGVTAMSDFASSQGVEAPGYAVVDAMVGYDFSERFYGQLNFNNVFDRDYHERVGSPGTFNLYGAPASVVASLRYDL